MHIMQIMQIVQIMQNGQILQIMKIVQIEQIMQNGQIVQIVHIKADYAKYRASNANYAFHAIPAKFKTIPSKF